MHIPEPSASAAAHYGGRSRVLDAARLLAALCIVWYHNSLFFSLSTTDQALVARFKDVLLTWAMPFFYVVMAGFALRRSLRSDRKAYTARRLAILARTILFFIVVYELPRLVFYGIETYGLHRHHTDYVPFGVDTASVGAMLRSLVELVMSVNHSPVYFLTHALTITVLAYVCSFFCLRFPKQLRYIAALTLVVGIIVYVFRGTIDMWRVYLPFNSLALITALGAFAYELIVSAHVSHGVGKLPASLGLFGALCLALGVLSVLSLEWFMVGAVAYLWWRDRYDGVHQLWLDRLAQWGASYSFGIFLWHYAVLMVIAAVGKTGLLGPVTIGIFAATTMVGFGVTLIVVFCLRRYHRTRWMVAM